MISPQSVDTEILSRFSDPGTRHDGFNLLISTYQEKLYWHIRRMVLDHEDANDVIQNVFLKVWKSLSNFRAESKLYTWLYRIATNESLTFINQKKKRYAISVDDGEYEVGNRLRADAFFNGDELQIKLQEAIHTLPDKQKAVFNLRYFEEMKYDDMSEIFGTSVGALKASYHHAVKKVENYIKRD